MVSLTRKLLLVTLVLSFVITVPIVLLMTAGYRLNMLKNRIEKTGIIEVESVPPGAKVYLNDAPQASVTPASLKRLLPEDYKVRMKLDGYFEWSKKLSVQSGITTFTSQVVLMRDTLPSLVESGDLIDGTWNPDRLRMAAIRRQANWQELVVWNRPQRTMTVLARNPIDEESEDRITWSPDGQKLLHLHAADGKTVAVIHSPGTAREPITVSKNLPLGVYQAKWSSDNQKVVFIGANGIFLTTGDGGSATPLAVGRFALDAVTRDSSSLILRNGENAEKILEKIDWPNGQPETIASLPEGSSRIVEWTGPTVVIADDRRGQIVIFDTNTRTTTELGGSEFVRWRQGTQVVSWSSFEVHLGDLATGKSELVTRLAEKIVGCAWHPAGSIIVCATDTQVFATETDGRSGRNTWQLAWGTNVSGLAVESVSGKIYFIAGIGQSKGIFERPL